MTGLATTRTRRQGPLAVAGPVAVTGATGHVGRALLRALAAHPNTVRAVGRRDDADAAFRDAEVVVHLAGALRPRGCESYADANVRPVARTVRSLAGSSVSRVVFLSYVGADPRSPNEYLRAKGEAEDLIHAWGKDAVIFRCSHIYGPPDDPGPTVEALRARDDATVKILGSGRQRVAPVFVGDVVEAIVRAVREPSAPHGRFDLVGPEVLAFDDFVRAVSGGSARLTHVPPLAARALAHVIADLTPALVDVMSRDSVGDATRVQREFGLALRRLADVYPPQSAAA